MPLTRNERGAALVGGVLLEDLFEPPPGGHEAARFKTPAYVYDLDGLAASARDLAAGFGAAPHLVAYAMKACSGGPILRALRDAGCGATVVSGGELSVALAAGMAPEQIVFNGVAKQAWEIDLALSCGAQGILGLHLESVEEIALVQARARALGRTARVAFRVNPDIDADTHHKVATGHDEAKFGVPLEDLGAAWEEVMRAPEMRLVGLSCHIGSQLTRTAETLRSAELLLGVAAAREASGFRFEYLDFGGGFGVGYGWGGETPPAPRVFAEVLAQAVASSSFAGRRIVIEPGRCVVAEHGVLCAGVVLVKRTRASATPRRWLVLDAGMNDLVRPAMYGAHHRVERMEAASDGAGEGEPFRVVGPVCESSDDFGEHVFGGAPPRRVVIRDAGAYGSTMASEYNGRPLPGEIFLRGGEVVAARKARTPEDWVALQMC
ncbi:diaminopimelate decarboxylase [Chondromyces apiculatus]|uniref:Diaminopimelate decarboxylase n=1 Tax=Chondromyces apiculatus DSM 436 TaxID=1192034 RepID=A0A017T775_9BACT|nr:diaminopimelate decarboxylase [Chondromyces apiculatus]EYF04650.1 Diaminopimelate decarboxylase [Chondromyces apiculatus DSM 436]